MSVGNGNENENETRKNEHTFAGSEKSEVDLLTTADDATPLPSSDGDEGAKADAPETRIATVMIEIIGERRNRVFPPPWELNESPPPQ